MMIFSNRVVSRFARMGVLALVASGLVAGSSSIANAVVNGCDTSGTTYPSSTGASGEGGFGGGQGIQGNPWRICSSAQLSGIGTNLVTLGAHYELRSDLDLSGADWTPIVMRDNRGFYGVFDGKFRSISNASITGELENARFHPNAAGSTTADLYGLFATVSGSVHSLEIRDFIVTSNAATGLGDGGGRFPSSGAIAGSCVGGGDLSQIRIVNTSIQGNQTIAGLVSGLVSSCDIDLLDASDSGNLVTTNSTVKTDLTLGGIIGRSEAPGIYIKRAHFGGTVGNNSFVSSNLVYAGGLIGNAVYGSVDESIVTGTIQGSQNAFDRTGGIAGSVANISSSAPAGVGIRNTVFAGNIDVPVVATDFIGGFVGISDTDVPVTLSLMIGSMPQNASDKIGPIGGSDTWGPASYSSAFYNSTVLSTFVPANEKGIAKTTAQLWDADLVAGTFSSWPIGLTGSAKVTTGWSFTTTDPIWRITAGDYPALIWQDFWPSKLTAPSNVTATSPSAGTASLSWTQPSGTVTGYRIESSSDGGTTWNVEVLDTGSNATTASVTGLTPGSSYIFRVSGFSNTAFSSSVSTPTASLLMGSNPGSPQNLAAVSTGPSSFRISWDPPANTGGLSLTGYTLQVDKGNGFETVSHTGTSAEITGVTINSLWSFRVLATNVVGDSAYATFTNTPPAPYTGPLVTNLSLFELDAGTSRQITIEGVRLNTVTSASVDGKSIGILQKTETQLVVLLPALTEGIKDLVLISSTGSLTHQDAFQVVVQEVTVVTESETRKLNAGSFKGYVALYARGYGGSRLSAKVGNDWVIVPEILNNQEDGNLFRFVEFTGAGYTINVRIFIDRLLMETITLVTK